MLYSSENVSGEGDAMDLFIPILIELDLQQAICILNFVIPFIFSLQSGQANKSKEKNTLKKDSVVYTKN